MVVVVLLLLLLLMSLDKVAKSGDVAVNGRQRAKHLAHAQSQLLLQTHLLRLDLKVESTF